MTFSMFHLELQTRLPPLAHHAMRAARSFFQVPVFFYYALADGIRTILCKRRTPPFDFSTARAGPLAHPDLFGFP